MRPRLSDNKKRNKPLILRVSTEEKIRIKSHTRDGKYPCMSDFIRTQLFNPSNKVIYLDQEASTEIKRMDYELNKIGVNFNQIAKKINIHDVYLLHSDDIEVFKQISERLENCFSVLQKYMDRVDPSKKIEI
jgi:hypothetical protein